MTATELLPRVNKVPDVSEKALNLFRNNLVWDNLLPWVPVYNIEEIDTILPRFRETGVNFFSLTLAAGAGAGASIETVIERIGRVKREIRERSDWLVFASTVEDIREAKAANKLAVNFNFQETLPFGRNLDMIQTYYDLGIRQALLAYNQKNLVGDGCNERTDAGLSKFGVDLIKEMNRVGMLVDGSHSGYRTTMDAMEVCEGPFIFSHSNPFGAFAHFRNIKDDQIDACAASGGVIGVVGAGGFLDDVNASTESIFRCLDYLVERAGPEHVGLGLDYVHDVESAFAMRKKSPTAWPNTIMYNYAGAEQAVGLTQMMIDHGYTDEDIINILGENWARVCGKVWK